MPGSRQFKIRTNAPMEFRPEWSGRSMKLDSTTRFLSPRMKRIRAASYAGLTCRPNIGNIPIGGTVPTRTVGRDGHRGPTPLQGQVLRGELVSRLREVHPIIMGIREVYGRNYRDVGVTRRSIKAPAHVARVLLCRFLSKLYRANEIDTHNLYESSYTG